MTHSPGEFRKAAMKKKKYKQKATAFIVCKLTPDDKKKIKQIAGRLTKGNISRLIRQSILGKSIKKR